MLGARSQTWCDLITPYNAAMAQTPQDLARDLHQWANVDIMVIDQLLRGRIPVGARIADLGCGGGRNITPFMQAGYEVWGCDESAMAIEVIQEIAQACGAQTDRFLVEPIEQTSLPHGYFDFVICNAVIHFARDAAHAAAMLQACMQCSKPGGIVFMRLATRDGWPDGIPSGSFSYLMRVAEIEALAHTHEMTFIDPVKITVVHQHRCMATVVLQAPL